MDLNTLPIEMYEDDEFLIRGTLRDGRPRLRVYRPSRTMVVLGRGSIPAVELELDACLADGVPLYRRRGGGCSVVLDPGNIIVSVAQPEAGLNHTRRHFDLLTDWLLGGLRAIGLVGVYRDGSSDLALAERKIAGSCVYRSPGMLYYSTTLLVEPDVDKIERYLKYPPREPEYRGKRSHHEFVGRLVGVGGITDTAHLATELEDNLCIDDLPEIDAHSPASAISQP